MSKSCCCPGQKASECTCSEKDCKKLRSLRICYTKNPLVKELLASYTPYELNNEMGKEIQNNARAAFNKKSVWPNGSTLKIGFFKKKFRTFDDKTIRDPEYTSKKATFVKTTVNKYIAPLVNLKFVWDVDDVSKADIRISFIEELGAYSQVGNESKLIPAEAETMNLGFLDDGRGEVGTTVVHEFCHALGMIHEHQREDVEFKWNKPAIYRDYGCPPNCWTEQDVDENIFAAEKISSYNGSKYDKYSIMHYWFPPEFFLNKNFKIPDNYVLSTLDKQWLSKTYPKKSSDSEVEQDVKSNWPLFIIIISIIIMLTIISFLIYRYLKK